MEKFLELLDSLGIVYKIQDGAVVVLSTFSSFELCFDNIIIPENTEFSEGLDLEDYNGEIQLPENLRVAVVLYLDNANVTRLPSNLTIDDCSVYLDAHKIENVSYRDDCGKWERTIFAFWANNDFLIAAGCFAGTYSKFATAVDRKYYDDDDASEYKRQARECISELAEKLGKTDPFKNQ